MDMSQKIQMTFKHKQKKKTLKIIPDRNEN